MRLPQPSKELEKLRDDVESFLDELISREDPNCLVTVSISTLGYLHIVIVSRIFENLEYDDRNDKVWPALREKFQAADLAKITICMLLTPAEGQPIRENATGASVE